MPPCIEAFVPERARASHRRSRARASTPNIPNLLITININKIYQQTIIFPVSPPENGQTTTREHILKQWQQSAPVTSARKSVKMNGRRSDASTSTDDLKDRPLCLFYFTHPFGVLSPEPPTVATAPAHIARAYLNMEPVSPLHFFSPATDSYDTRTTSSDRLSFDLGNAQVHKNPVNLVSVAKTRKCTIDLGIPRDTMSSSLLSSDIWFSSGSSSRSYEYTRRLIPYNRILPPLQLPAPQDTSTADSSDDLWPIKCVNPARFSLPPIKLPKVKVTKAKSKVNSERVDEVSSVESISAKDVKCRRIVGVKKHRKRTHAAQLSGVRRMLTRLMQRAVKGRKEGSSSSPALREVLTVIRRAWPEPRSLFDHCRAVTRMSHTVAPAAAAEPRREPDAAISRLALPPPGASPGLLRRRYSVPETIMRKYRLAQQRSDSEETGAATSPSPASASPPRGSCNSLCDTPQRFARRDRELMRKSALLRRLWGRTPPCDCCDETRSLDTSRSELRPLSTSLPSSRHSHAGWASPKRQRLEFPRDLRSSEEMLRAAMRNSYERAEESRCAKRDCSDSSCVYRGQDPSYLDATTDVMTDSDTSKFDINSERNAYIDTQFSDRLSSEAVTVEIKSEHHDAAVAESETSAVNAQVEDKSSADSSDTFSTSVSTAKETNGSVPKFPKQISKSAHIDGRISERSVSVENDDNNVLPYDTPLTVETPSYELEIVVSETSNNVPALKSVAPEPTVHQTLKAPPNHRFPQHINIDEYVSNILVESLNSLTDQLECMNASIGNDHKINIVEKEIKVKLQNTGVNTIVHLSPTSNNQIIFGNEELCNNDGRKDSCNNPADARDSVTIREEMISVESNNNLTSAGSAREPSPPPQPFYEVPFGNMIHHDNVNKAVLQQIQKLFQDELQNMDSDIGYRVGSIPGVSHIEISNVDVYLDDNSDPALDRNETIEMHTQHNVEISEIISGVGAGNYCEDVENNLVVPRFSAFPHTDSMEVNTSSSDDAELIGSDCTSLVDSLDDPNSPRSILLRRSFNNNGIRRSELVRSAIDVLDLLPGNSPKDDDHHKERGEAFFVRIKDDDCDCEKENVIVADHMPEKIKQRLYRRHRKRELRMECARRSKVKQLKRELERQRYSEVYKSRKEIERECVAIINALVDEVIAKIAQDEYKCMRIKQKPSKMVGSKSDENIAKKTWRKDIDLGHSKESFKTSRSGAPIVYMDKPDRSQKRSDRHRIHGKLSLLTQPSSPSPEERGPKRIYQKSEIHDGNKCIEILEILEYVNGSQSSPETTTSDENHNHKSKKSRIPVPVSERIQKTPKYSKAHHSSSERLVSSPVAPPHGRSKKSNNSLANMLMEVLADDDSPERTTEPARRVSVPHEPRSRSNSLRFKRVFDSIPEERSGVSFDSSAEDTGHARRASAPTLVDTVNLRPNNGAQQTERARMEEVSKSSNPSRGKDTKSAGTSPLVDVEAEKRVQKLKSQMTMTSPSHKSAATSPMRGSNGAPAAASGKRGLSSRGRAWLGFTRPDAGVAEGSKETSVEVDASGERRTAATQSEGPRTVRTIQTETSDPVIVRGDRPRDRSGSRARGDEAKRRETRTRRARGKSKERRAPDASDGEPTESPPARGREGVVRTDKRKIRTISVERSEEETVRTKSVRLPEFKANAGMSSSSDSSDSGGSLLCSLAPKWLSSHTRHKRGARRRDGAVPSSPPTAAAAPLAGEQRTESDEPRSSTSGGWSVTVAGTCRAALPADLEMRLRFPNERHPQHSQQQQYSQQAQYPQRLPRDTDRRQECQCGACSGACCSAAHAQHAPLPHPDAGKLKLTMKKEALDSSIHASKSTKKSSDPLPDLETFRASRSKTKSSVKTRRGYSLHCWLPDDAPAPMRSSNGLSVLGCAIIPELKPRVPTMSERDLTRAYTPRHYLRS